MLDTQPFFVVSSPFHGLPFVSLSRMFQVKSQKESVTEYINIAFMGSNMFSVLAASALLPFLPMMSIHLIFLNLICDLSCTAIPWDNVDEEFIAKPRRWDASSVGNFMLWIGPTSSIFDFTTYLFLYFIFCPMVVSEGVLFNDLPAHFSGAELAMMQAKYIGLFQAGWFVESMWSQTFVIHMIRTPKLAQKPKAEAFLAGS